MQPETKRQNFNITPEQEAELNWLRGALGAPTAKEAILRAIHVLAAVARDLEEGGRLYVHDSSGKITRVIIPELETAGRSPWKYLVERPHPWRRQMYLKGRRLLASTVWSDLRANGTSLEEAAENWNLPREAVEECMRYGEANADLIRMEAEEEGRGSWLQAALSTLKLLLDEDSQAKALIRLLIEAGHDVQTVADGGLNGHPDVEILRHAHGTGRTILTRNTGDFLGLHQSGFAHAGILAVFQEGDPLKNLSYAAIVRAIDNFLSAEVPIEGQFIPLNAWSY